MSAGINKAILDLLNRKRLSATSCMTTLPDWRSGARELVGLAPHAAIGLHLNLTEGEGTRPLHQIILAGLFRRLQLRALCVEIERQLDAFEDAIGAPPAFVDGHQHVQMLPQVRTALTTVLKRRYRGHLLWIRNARPPLDGHDAQLKALVLRGIGTGFETALGRAGLPVTRYFVGLYSLRPDAEFPRLMEGWLHNLPDGALVMCHPGQADDAVPLAAIRGAEADYLRSDRFGDAMEKSGIHLIDKPVLAEPWAAEWPLRCSGT